MAGLTGRALIASRCAKFFKDGDFVNLGIGLLTPPVGAALYVGSAVSGMSVGRTTKALLPFYLLLVVTLLVLTFVPQITMFLPRMMGLA